MMLFLVVYLAELAALISFWLLVALVGYVVESRWGMRKEVQMTNPGAKFTD